MKRTTIVLALLALAFVPQALASTTPTTAAQKLMDWQNARYLKGAQGSTLTGRYLATCTQAVFPVWPGQKPVIGTTYFCLGGYVPNTAATGPQFDKWEVIALRNGGYRFKVSLCTLANLNRCDPANSIKPTTPADDGRSAN